jgi:uncharacterized damage-inducible protein DinB
MNAIAKELLVGFDEEATTTRKVLERVPLTDLTWKPHQKSTPIGRLAAHVATLPKFASTVIKESSYDLDPTHAPAEFATADELVTAFQESSQKARAAIEHATDAQLGEPWTLTVGGKKIFTLPRAQVIRMYTLNHLIHHRAQLGVYLRLNEVPVPGSYGPSADERVA